jgi:hypothetical protein
VAIQRSVSADGKSTAPALGRLTQVELRDYWKEENAFTRWLARDENLELLSEALGIQLQLDGTHVRVGSYEADVLAKDPEGEQKVVIENQLGKTDHDHLGKALVYSAGLGAKTVVWLATKITDEHRQTLQWLNEATGESLRFFGLEIELWCIGGSPPAPRFNVICSPNEWVNVVRTPPTTASAVKNLQLDFWQAFQEHLRASGARFRGRTPRPEHWYDFAIGRSGFNLSLTVNTQKKRLGCELYISHDQAKSAYGLLRQQRRQIDQEIGATLDWMELPGKNACRIIQYREGDMRVREKWPELFQWLSNRLDTFNSTFTNRIHQLAL